MGALETLWWLLESIHDRYPWLGPALVVAVLVAGLLSCASISARPGGRLEVRPGLRVLTVCADEAGVVREVRAYPLSRSLAGSLVLLGAGIGAAVAGPAGAAGGAALGALAEAVVALWSRPDPELDCPPGGVAAMSVRAPGSRSALAVRDGAARSLLRGPGD